MHFRFQPWQLALLLIAVCAASVAGVYLYRTRGGSHPSDLVSYLPTANATVVYVDVDSLRRMVAQVAWRVAVLLAFPMFVFAAAAVASTVGQIGFK